MQTAIEDFNAQAIPLPIVSSIIVRTTPPNNNENNLVDETLSTEVNILLAKV